MSLMAKCPKCGIENSPMNATCDACQAPLGTALVDEMSDEDLSQIAL